MKPAPNNDAARVVAGRVGEQERSESPDCAASLVKREATATARAALLGIAAQRVAADAWVLRYAQGSHIGLVRGLPALEAAVAGFEAARDDVAKLVQRARGGL